MLLQGWLCALLKADIPSSVQGAQGKETASKEAAGSSDEEMGLGLLEADDPEPACLGSAAQELTCKFLAQPSPAWLTS